MSPQFVDFNGDGHLDIVAGIFDGSPHVAFGDGKGYKQPETIKDKDGQRIVMNAFWNFDAKKWDETTRCDPEGQQVQTGHLTSAWAADWDGDGDLDLLLGDHRSGQVMVRHNEGTDRQPAFATRNAVVMAAGKPLVVPGTVTTLRLFDWDGDGVKDLLVGSMGDAYGTGPGGGVFVHRNEGSDAAPRLAAATTLIAASNKGAKSAERPDAGLHMDVMDWDGDGDLDLVVGGYSIWTPDAPVLDDAQKALVATLQKDMAEIGKQQQAIYQEVENATKDLEGDAADTRRRELLKARTEELRSLSTRRADIAKQLDPLVPGAKRQSYTWLYENLAKGGAAVEASTRR